MTSASTVRLEVTATGSPTGEENRQFFERRATCPRQYNVARGIVQFEAAEGNGDELAGQSGKIADGKNNENAAIIPKNEIGDPPDRIVWSLTTGINLSASAR